MPPGQAKMTKPTTKNVPKPATNTPTGARNLPALNPKAKAFVPGARSVSITGHADAVNNAIKKPRRRRAAPKVSPHRKWARPGGPAPVSAMDKIIKGISTSMTDA